MNEILVIDDNLDIRVLISGILKDKGYFIDVKGARPFFEVTKDSAGFIVIPKSHKTYKML